MPEKSNSSRTERRKLRNEQKKERREETKGENRKYRRRLFPIWLRILVVLVLTAVALLLGLMVGYGVIGDGNPTDALKIETWRHIINLVTTKE